jgi:hypothetical protein
VLLYELLTGTTPFDAERCAGGLRRDAPHHPRGGAAEAEHAAQHGEALPTISANRATEPAKLTKLVRGELDWIVMKALEKDRNRRYETANGFAPTCSATCPHAAGDVVMTGSSTTPGGPGSMPGPSAIMGWTSKPWR